MTQQTNPTAPPFLPVPAIPIVVLPAYEGVRAVSTAAGIFAGPTLREAIQAATVSTPATTALTARELSIRPVPWFVPV